MENSTEIFVDGASIIVNGKGNLIDELRKHNIEIPHFCYHSELGVDGNCRMCLIEVKGQKRPQIACDFPIKEGMELLINSDLTRSVQRSLLELELINHPIDCPVCDQAGECDLQNYYMKYDLATSKVPLSNKVDKSKNLDYGCGVVHDQERCVLCARCVRFTEKITKTKELGIQKRGDESRIVIFPGRPIDNKYAGNIIDICPVGAMTSKDFRFKKRVWRLEPVESICQGCSKGCAIFIDHVEEKYEEDKIYRYRPLKDEKVNGSFMCDEGRYSYKEENENRAKTENYKSALYLLKTKLETNRGKVNFIVSPKMSTEELFFAKELCKNFDGQINGYSDFLIKEDADGYLIQNDKSANRKSLDLLEIASSEESFKDLINSNNINVVFNLGEMNKELLTLLEGKENVFVSSHKIENQEVIACKSFSERSGHTLNCDGILREMKKAKNSSSLEIREIIEIILEDSLDFPEEILGGVHG